MGSRRSFLLNGIGIGAFTLCAAACEKGGEASRDRILPVGAKEQFSLPKTYLKLEKLLIVRDSGGLGAMSLNCTHQGCLIEANGESSPTSVMVCPCHGAVFSAEGRVLQGPASRDLPWFRLSIDPTKGILVHLGEVVDSNWRLPI